MLLLTTLLKMFLAICCLLIGLLLIILLTAFSYHIKVRIGEKISMFMIFTLLFGLLKIKVIREKEKPKIKGYIAKFCVFSNDFKFVKKEINKKKRKTKFEFPGIEFFADLFTLINKVFKQVKPKTFAINGVYGFEDPSHTGITSAAICFIKQSAPSYEISLTPVFEKRILDIEINAKGNFKVLILVSFVLKFILKRRNKFWKIIHHLKKT